VRDGLVRGRRIAASSLFLLSALHAGTAAGQTLTRPHIAWRTIETAHFAFHFPAEMSEWTLAVARRMESTAAAVHRLVGNSPATRVTVLVEDPSNVANGFALPFLEGPVMFLWPTPPAPGPTIGTHRGWGEALAVHEYGHIAHLTIPTRNPGQRLLWRFAPTRLGPVSINAPRWVIEGYATVIEGKLTGSGRPNSVGRAAVLREWALEGKLPQYAQLDASGTFAGGNMRYLVGSAFLEWLEARKGDSSLAHLWRRMSARQIRTFGEAFVGVFGAPAPDLYGKFTVDITDQSLQIERQLRAAGLVEGELFQKLSWGTGEPAVSPDGKLLAVVVRSPVAPARLVIWRTAATPPDSALIQRRERARQLDPLDVPAIDSFPPPKRSVATLAAVGGRSHEQPRWLPDGVRLIVSRDEPMGDGTTRPDLFIWNYRTRDLRRLTRGAAIRQADPSPDGRRAAAVQCLNGICSVVIVDLSSGSLQPLVRGTADVVWHRPRWSPDGRSLVAGYQSGPRWRAAVIDAASGDFRVLEPMNGDGASRYAPTWTPDGGAVIAVSERGGIANLERMDVETGASAALTRVIGGVHAPDVDRTSGVVYFLALHAKGYDVRRVGLQSTAEPVVTLEERLAPAAPHRGFAVPLFAAESLPRVRPYGFGPRGWRLLPGFIGGADGLLGTLMLANIDPIARLTVLAQGGFGERGTWRGGAMTAALRSTPVTVEPAVWYVDRRPGSDDASRVPTAHESAYLGAGLAAELSRQYGVFAYGARAGASGGVLRGEMLDDAPRYLGFGQVSGSANFSAGARALAARASILFTAGQTASESWTRTMVSGRFAVGPRSWPLVTTATFGLATAAEAGEQGRAYEEFVVGGSEVPYFDPTFVSQYVPMPGVPLGFARGSELGTVRLGLGGFTVEPFMSWTAAGAALERWQRVVGAEWRTLVTAYGFARLPEVRASAGASYSLDEPFRHEARAWVSVIYRP
jgi:hypothetical protein